MLVRLAIGLGLIAFDIMAFMSVAALLPDTGRLMTEFPRLEHERCERQPGFVPLTKISKPLYRAVLLLEDSRFWQHRGVDFFEINVAINQALAGRRLRGASTISQQLVKNLYLSSDRSFWRKFVEALITIKLENTVSKERILELYLNIIDWGRCTIGIRRAATIYFDKHPSELSVKEAVFLAAIIPNPARFSRFTTDEIPREFVRAQMVRALNNLYKNAYITIDDFEDALLEPIDF